VYKFIITVVYRFISFVTCCKDHPSKKRTSHDVLVTYWMNFCIRSGSTFWIRKFVNTFSRNRKVAAARSGVTSRDVTRRWQYYFLTKRRATFWERTGLRRPFYTSPHLVFPILPSGSFIIYMQLACARHYAGWARSLQSLLIRPHICRPKYKQQLMKKQKDPTATPGQIL